LYLDDDLWVALHVRAQIEKTTVSELVRKAVRERYLDSREQRIAAMERFVGIRKLGGENQESSREFRHLLTGSRLDRFGDG
jgi:hypothetical protein